MEEMPYQPHCDQRPPLMPFGDIVATDWRAGLPVLSGELVTLRELRTSDAGSLFAMLASEEVTRFISPPPSTVEGFARFIAWTRRQRQAGQHVGFAIVPRGIDTAVGLFQIRTIEPGFSTVEAGCALGSEYWGSGMFVEGAQLVGEFAFETLGVHRIEARAALRNGRGAGALRKLGFVQEGVLRGSLLRNGQWLDQALWSAIDEDYYRAKAVWGERAVVH